MQIYNFFEFYQLFRSDKCNRFPKWYVILLFYSIKYMWIFMVKQSQFCYISVANIIHILRFQRLFILFTCSNKCNISFYIWSIWYLLCSRKMPLFTDYRLDYSRSVKLQCTLSQETLVNKIPEIYIVLYIFIIIRKSYLVITLDVYFFGGVLDFKN